MAHAPEVKAMAVGLILTGHTVNSIARRLEVPRQTVSRWHLRLADILAEALIQEGKYPPLPEVGRRMGIKQEESGQEWVKD